MDFKSELQMKLIKEAINVWAIENFLDLETCNDLITEMESTGYFEESLYASPIEKKFDITNRLFFKSEEFAEIIWNNIKEYVPRKYHERYTSIGVNEQFRLYKYFKGQVFESHQDSPCIRNENERSFYSLLIYFNDNFKGGETIFENLSIKPKVGKAVFFPHTLIHSGALVIEGSKYILRTDIMYRLNVNL